MPDATVNGVTFSSKHVRAFLPTGYVLELKSIEYGDNLEKKTQNNMNGIPIGETQEDYKADCKFDIGVTEYNKLVALSAAFGGIYQIPAFPIVINYLNGSAVTFTDTLTVSIKKSSRKVGEKDQWIGQSIECNVVGPVLWSGVPAYTPGA
ncbi:MAG TPA: hypothetical protein PK771_01515 [Spirochaetota bacterium]|nr:hypothetical protein [Spirochaetota bacterium]